MNLFIPPILVAITSRIAYQNIPVFAELTIIIEPEIHAFITQSTYTGT